MACIKISAAFMARLRHQFCAIVLFFIFLYIWVPQRCDSSRNNRDKFNSFIKRDYLLDRIDIYCEGIFENDNSSVTELESWKFDQNSVEEQLLEAEDRCALINELFEFRKLPLSKEEEEFPLAYGLLVYKEISQVLFMLSSFYHPQNEYCIAVSGSSAPAFKVILRQLDHCFPNIHVMERPPISWGSFEIINSTYSCLKYLSSLKSDWKYFQYLSGVDVPIRTNLEMVKILKAFNGTPNVEFLPFEKHRANGKNLTSSPLPLFKSSLSAIIPRKTANVMTHNPITRKLLHFLVDTKIADETFWGTLTGNVKDFPIPGGLDAKEILNFKDKLNAANKKKKKNESVVGRSLAKLPYYLSRYQVWKGKECKGKMKSNSCVFGVNDLAIVMKQPYFVAHKFYIDFQPAAFFCALKEIKHRSMHPIRFETKLHGELPQIELRRGIPLKNVTHPSWIL